MAEQNRLAQETSPYLLQHATNPVDWYPWGPEALEAARTTDRPIFLSIGYSACHWCHVMERESFSDPETAELLNENFVCIKVDREERPDIDSLYMDATQAMTGHGGWPMSVFLTPAGEPFFAGTYFPPEPKGGMPSFKTVLQGVIEAWRERRDDVATQSAKVVTHLRSLTPTDASHQFSKVTIPDALNNILSNADQREGGFGGAPKFPQAPTLELLAIGASMRDVSATQHLQLTATRMAKGGIYDQLAGGFHRYSTDERWIVPHFEKMLYDNAQLLRVYIRTWKLTGDRFFREIAEGIAGYIISDLKDPTGGFHASEDADSEGEEGRFYLWSRGELDEAFPGVAEAFGATEVGDVDGLNVLTAQGQPPDGAVEKLLALREQRERPGKDDKILASWNGLTIGALAEAGASLGRPDLTSAAITAAEFVLGEMATAAGGLFHSFRQGEARVNGLLEDYAFMADGLLALWEATFDPRFFTDAERLATYIRDHFRDPQSGALFTTADDHEELIVRQTEIIESATPSPAATAAGLMAKLGVIKGSDDWLNHSRAAIAPGLGLADRAPAAVPTSLATAAFLEEPTLEIVIVGEQGSSKWRQLADVVRSRYLPFAVVAGGPPGIDSPLFEGRLDSLEPTAYVCQNFVCQEPAKDPQTLARQLGPALDDRIN